MTIRISKNRIFFRNFRHFQRRFSQRVRAQKSKPIPPFDSKFSADIENGVIFEQKQSRFRGIQRYVQHGKSGSYMTYPRTSTYKDNFEPHMFSPWPRITDFLSRDIKSRDNFISRRFVMRHFIMRQFPNAMIYPNDNLSRRRFVKITRTICHDDNFPRRQFLTTISKRWRQFATVIIVLTDNLSWRQFVTNLLQEPTHEHCE